MKRVERARILQEFSFPRYISNTGFLIKLQFLQGNSIIVYTNLRNSISITPTLGTVLLSTPTLRTVLLCTPTLGTVLLCTPNTGELPEECWGTTRKILGYYLRNAGVLPEKYWGTTLGMLGYYLRNTGVLPAECFHKNCSIDSSIQFLSLFEKNQELK